MFAVLLLVVYATGVAVAQSLPPWPVAGYALFAALLATLWVLLRRSPLAWLPLLALLMMAGVLNCERQLQPPDGSAQLHLFAERGPVVIEGRIRSIEQRAAGGAKVQIEALAVITKQQRAQVAGTLLLTIREGAPAAQPGQVVRWRARLHRPRRFGNPGEFDYPLFLAAGGIYATASIKRADELVVMAGHPAATREIIANLRQRLAGRIASVLPAERAGLLQALLLGERAALSTAQREALATSGTAHLFAISGLHFGLLALVLYQLARQLYTRSVRLTLWQPPQRVIPLLLLAPLFAYLLLTGNAWSTQRAFGMVAISAWLLLAQRCTRPPALLATAALALLIASPLALFQAGFQLSMSGVAGILAWLPAWQQRLNRLPAGLRWPLLMLLTTAAATAATLPAVLWHFHRFAPAGLLGNLVAIPLIAWGALPLGLLGLGVTSLPGPLSSWLLSCAGELAALALRCAVAISNLPGLGAISYGITAGDLLILSGLLLLCLPQTFAGPRRYRAVIFTGLLIAALVINPTDDNLQVTAISVGQGDATLLSLDRDHHYLIDGGGMPGSDFDPGERLVAPALARLGVRRLDGVILSHNHPDHVMGLSYILKHLPVANVYLAGDAGRYSTALQQAIRRSGAQVQNLEQGMTLLHSAPTRTLALYVPDQEQSDPNDTSIAVYAAQGQGGVLLTADLGRTGLASLRRLGLPGPVTLLKLPHHGSRNSDPAAWLDWLQPKLAFASAGSGNVYGFPHQQTVAACNGRNVRLFSTDHDGMLSFHLEGGRWQIRPGLYN